MSCRASLIIITLSLGVACSEPTPSLPSEEVQVLRDRGASSPTAYQARDMDSTIPPELDDIGLGSTPHDMGIFGGGESMSDVDPLPPAGSDDPLPLRAPSNGTLSIRYANDYLLDNYQSRDPDYLNMHRRSVQNNPAFFGELVDRNLPDSGEPGVIYEVFGLQAADVGLVAILQMGFDASTNLPVNPFIQLSLDTTLVNTEDGYELSSDQRKSRLMLFNVNPDLSFKCVSQLGFGSINIPTASDLTLSEGGTIGIYGSDLPLYAPQETPAGDLTDLLIAEGKTPCAVPNTDPGPSPGSDPDSVMGDPTDLVINEIDYASPGADQGEFIEIYNVGPYGVSLDSITLELVRGDLSVYQRVPLSRAGDVLAAGDFIVLGDDVALDLAPTNALRVPLRDSIQNGGSGNGARLVFEDVVFEALGYGGLSLGEGSCLVEDDDRRDGAPASLGRCGVDTDTNADDFYLLSRPTPGVANVCP